MSHRYSEKQKEMLSINDDNKEPTKKENKPVNHYSEASNTADKIIIFIKSGVLKIIFGILLLIIGLTAIIGLVEVIQKGVSTGIFYFSALVIVGIFGGIGLIVWYNLVNVKKNTTQVTKDNLEIINKVNAKAQPKKTLVEEIVEKNNKKK